MKPYLIQPKKMAPSFVQLLRYIFLKFIRLYIKEVNGLENLPKQGPYIIAANHVDFTDGFLLAGAVIPYLKRMVYFVAKTMPLGWFWKEIIVKKWAGTIHFDPKNKDSCLIVAMDYIASGRIIGFFPEGFDSPEKDLQRGKTGAARLVLWAKVPLVPVGIYSRHSKTRIGAVMRVLLDPKHVKIIIGKPMKFDKYYNQEITKELLEQVTREIMQEIGKLCGKIYLY